MWLKMYHVFLFARGLLIALMTGSKHLWNVGKFYHTTQRNIPKDSNYHIHRRENLKSGTFKDRLLNMLSLLTRSKNRFRIPRYSRLHDRNGAQCGRNLSVRCEASHWLQTGRVIDCRPSEPLTADRASHWLQTERATDCRPGEPLTADRASHWLQTERATDCRPGEPLTADRASHWLQTGRVTDCRPGESLTADRASHWLQTGRVTDCRPGEPLTAD
jgi:hypothetical protein